MVQSVKTKVAKNKPVSTKTTDKAKKKEKKEKKKEKKQQKNNSNHKKPHKNEAKSSSNSHGHKTKSKYSFIDSAFKALLSARFCAAMWSNLADCDETYNYWEPSHFLLYGKGFQTWEYSPAFALRSYTYLLLHVVPAWLYGTILQPNRMLIFYYLRCVLGLFCAYCESYFYRSVCKEFGDKVGRLFLVFLLFSPGMFVSSTAFLPSSFSMYMALLAYGAWFNKKYELAIFTTAISTYLSWPFAGMLGVPIAMDMLIFRRQYKKFISWSVVSSIVIVVPMVRMDSELYGKFVIAPVNIVLYNIFTSHGPNLYGEEPFSFYFINCLLNFNVAFVAGLAAPVFLLIRNYVLSSNRRHWQLFSCWLEITPFYIWFPLFSVQPHKEERFLYPVFPFIALCGALCINSLEIIFSAVLRKFFGKNSFRLANSQVISMTAGGLAILCGLSRILALYKGYHAPIDLYMELNRFNVEGRVDPNAVINVCVGKEWYRFPSSFFLPNNNWNLKFLESDFKGQLPGEFSSEHNSTHLIHPHFNNLNREERSRYFDINKCHFLIDSDLGRSSRLEPNYSERTNEWTIVKSIPFLNSAKSHRFFRAFYIPFLSYKYCDYGHYNLLQSKKFKLREEIGQQ